MEIWKDVPGYEGHYQVSNTGKVKSLDKTIINKRGSIVSFKGRVLKFGFRSTGYYKVLLCKSGFNKDFSVHQLVAMAFLGHKPDGLNIVVNHKNFNILDNRVENLEVVSQRENSNRKHIDSSSKYVGVTWYKRQKKWASRIVVGRKIIYLGFFDCEIKASEAYQKALSKINQNSPQSKRSNNSQSPS